jgi:hypothetical protein
MLCRKCGTEIADKALICFRCGSATTDPVFAPPPANRRKGGPNLLVSILALLFLALMALYMGRAAAGEMPRLVTWIGAGIAAAVIVLRLYTRRR